MYICGDLAQPVCYVTILDQKYWFDDPLVAFDKYFHIFWGLNLKYPKECQQIWAFFQIAVFQITTLHDVISPQLKQLLKDVNN